MRSPRPWCFSHPMTAATSRERNCLWMAASHKCRSFTAEGTALRRAFFSCESDGLPLPHGCPDPRDQLPRRERLRHAVVGAELESENLVPFLDPPRDHDHGDSGEVRVLLEAPADLPAVQLGHHDVEQYHVRTHLAREPQSVGAVRRRDDIVTLLGEAVAD